MARPGLSSPTPDSRIAEARACARRGERTAARVAAIQAAQLAYDAGLETGSPFDAVTEAAAHQGWEWMIELCRKALMERTGQLALRSPAYAEQMGWGA